MKKIGKILILILLIIVLIVAFIFGIEHIKNNTFKEKYVSRVAMSQEVPREDYSRIEEPELLNEQKIVNILGKEVKLVYKYTQDDKRVYNDEVGVEYIFSEDKLIGFLKSLPLNTDKKLAEEEAKEIALNFIKEMQLSLDGFELSSYNYRYGEHCFIYVRKFLDHRLNSYISVNVHDTGEITAYQYIDDEKYENLKNMNIDKEMIEKAFKIKVAEKLNINPEDCVIEFGSISVLNNKLVYMATYNVKPEIMHAHDEIIYYLEK